MSVMSTRLEAKGTARRQLRGASEIARALDEGAPLRLLVCAREVSTAEDSILIARAERQGIPVHRVSHRELLRVGAGGGEGAENERSTMLGMIGGDPKADLSVVMKAPGAIWMLTGTAYPGNAGFVIRSAEVSGAAGVVIDAAFDRTARRDAFRAAMRADRYLPVFFEGAGTVLDAAARARRRIVAIEDVGGAAPWEIDLTGPVLFVVGGEVHGIDTTVLNRAHQVIRIPMAGFMRSYNLQAAVAAVLGERLRQERTSQRRAADVPLTSP